MMQRNGFHATDTELNLLNARFDRNLNGYIKYQDFMDEILPRSSLLGEIVTLNLLKKVDVNLARETENEEKEPGFRMP
jgi:hypothetical protein